MFYQMGFSLSFQEALSKGLITLQIQENPSSTHYYAPLLISVKNVSTNTLSLELENGQLLEPEIDSFQQFIVTQHLLVNLVPNQKKDVPVFAMCTEQDDSAPYEDVLYTFGKKANSLMNRLSFFVEQNKMFEPDAQFLMWEFAEGKYKEEEVDGFEIDEDGSVWVVQEIEGENVVVNKTVEVVEDPHKPKLIVNGAFEMNFSSPKNVHIAMFNKQHVIVKELYKNPVTPTGSTKLNYEFNSYDFEDEEYYVKLIVNGSVILTRTIEMSY
jgi:hypothetical protein